MKDYVQSLFVTAKKNKDIKMLKALYNGNPNNYKIKFCYAKTLIDINHDAKEKNMEQYEEARKLLIELLDTRNRNYALFELGKLEISLDNFNKAKEFFEQLLTSVDSCLQDKEYAALELGRIESSFGNFDKARNYFNSLLKTPTRDLAKVELGKLEIEHGDKELGKNYLYNLIKDKSDNLDYAMALLSIMYLKENNYDELIKFIEKYHVKLNYRTSLFLSKELNIFFDAPYNDIPYSYTMNQIIDYDEYMAAEHIVDRHNSNSTATKFNPDIDIYKLFIDIQKELIDENKVNKLVLNDIYVIEYPNIGINGEDYLKVVTMHDSKNILSMYPIKSKYYIDSEEKEESKQTYENNYKKKTIKR